MKPNPVILLIDGLIGDPDKPNEKEVFVRASGFKDAKFLFAEDWNGKKYSLDLIKEEIEEHNPDIVPLPRNLSRKYLCNFTGPRKGEGFGVKNAETVKSFMKKDSKLFLHCRTHQSKQKVDGIDWVELHIVSNPLSLQVEGKAKNSLMPSPKIQKSAFSQSTKYL